jgi:hypothetical protein
MRRAASFTLVMPKGFTLYMVKAIMTGEDH